MKEETFKRTNEVGVSIEYEVIAHYPKDGREYVIYTDFVPTNDIYKIRLFADEKIADNKLERLDAKKEKEVIESFYNEVMKNIVSTNSKIETKEVQEEQVSNDRIKKLEKELERAIEKKDDKEIIHLRGQIIKELSQRIKAEKDPIKKEELEKQKRDYIDEHKKLINKKYKTDYSDKKKNIKGIVTVLPKGVALAFKKVAVTIEELKLAKTTKQKAYGMLETIKSTLQLLGTPIDFTIRFAVNHWYLALLLLTLGLPDKIPSLFGKKSRQNDNQEVNNNGIGEPETVAGWGVSNQGYSTQGFGSERVMQPETTAGWGVSNQGYSTQGFGSERVMQPVIENITSQVGELSSEVTQAMEKVSEEFINSMKHNNHIVLGEDLPYTPTIIHSPEEYVNYVKSINPKVDINIENALVKYQENFRDMSPYELPRDIIWPEAETQMLFFATKEDLVRQILSGENAELTQCFENFDNQTMLDKIINNPETHQMIEDLAKNLGISVAKATILVSLAYATFKVAEFAAIGPLALHP